MAEKLKYLNDISPENMIGNQIIDNAFTNLNDNELGTQDLAELINFAYSKTKNLTAGKMTEEQAQNLKNLIYLPGRLAGLIKKEPNQVAHFLKYIITAHNELDLKKLGEKYDEFTEIVINNIFANKKYSEILRIKNLGISWGEIKEFYEENENPTGVERVNKFELLQNKYTHIDLYTIAELYRQAQ